jgi:hypothetical protein
MVRLIAEKIDITPNFATNLAGFSNRNTVVSKVNDTIELNVSIIENNGNYYFIASFDLLFITSELQTVFINIFKTLFPTISQYNTFLCASHTHFAPCIDNRELLGVKDHRYIKFLEKKIHDIFKNISLKKFEECNIEIEEFSLSDINCNRRRELKSFFGHRKKIVMEPVTTAPVNSILTSINFVTQDSIACRLLNFTCHPTNNPDTNSISSEFVGTFRNTFRGKHNSLPVVFMQGFSGDVRAYPTKRYSIQRKIYELINRSFPIKCYKFSQSQYNKWLKEIEEKLQDQKPKLIRIHPEFVSCKNNSVEINDLGIECKHASELNIKSLHIGDLIILFISAEVLSGYEDLFLIPRKKILFVGYEGNCFGYLPTNYDLRKGGYEADEFKKYFDVTGKFNSNFEEIIKKSVWKVL